MEWTSTLLTGLEIFSVICNLAFILYLTRRKSIAWVYGIIGSLSGALLFYMSKYYAEAGLYLFYGLIGVYGWYVWTRPEVKLAIKKISWVYHAALLFLGSAMTVGLGSILSGTDADKPYYDAFSSVFGVFATFLELNRVLSGWIYWIILNLFSIWLYASKGIWVYAGLMVIYTALSFKGYRSWKLAYDEGN